MLNPAGDSEGQYNTHVRIVPPGVKSEGQLSSNFVLSLGERQKEATSVGGRKHEQGYALKLQGERGRSGAS